MPNQNVAKLLIEKPIENFIARIKVNSENGDLKDSAV